MSAKAWLMALLAVFVASCGGDDSAASDSRYSAEQLAAGVAIEVGGDRAVVSAAEVFLPDSLPSYLDMHPALEADGVAVMNPGEGGPTSWCSTERARSVDCCRP